MSSQMKLMLSRWKSIHFIPKMKDLGGAKKCAQLATKGSTHPSKKLRTPSTYLLRRECNHCSISERPIGNTNSRCTISRTALEKSCEVIHLWKGEGASELSKYRTLQSYALSDHSRLLFVTKRRTIRVILLILVVTQM